MERDQRDQEYKIIKRKETDKKKFQNTFKTTFSGNIIIPNNSFELDGVIVKECIDSKLYIQRTINMSR